jgi:cold shock CspA family protein
MDASPHAASSSKRRAATTAGGFMRSISGLHWTMGREVNVARTPPEDERYGDVDFAINDTFKHARRRLQDQARRMEGQVKAHEAQPVGTVTRLDRVGGFGFLETADNREIYFHENSVLDGSFARLEVGTRVSFAEEAGEKGPQASTVKLLGKHGLR